MKRLFTVALVPVLMIGLFLVGCDEDNPVEPKDSNPVVNVISPNGGEAINPGATVDIEWSATDDGAVDKVTLSYKADGQTDFTQIVDNQPSSGTYTWTVPATTLFGVKIKAVATDDGGFMGGDQSDGTFAVVPVSPRGYVMSTTCQVCHPNNYDEMIRSGHPFKINKVVNGQPPTYPFSTVPDPPSTLSWNDISYVIGGYGWKARFMDLDGYIYTDGWNGVVSQYNLPRADLGGGLPAEWVPYHASDTAPKPFTCGTCHTTGWQTFDENGGVNQDGLEGIRGTWEEPGIRCEACHGAGGTHVASKNADDININGNKELCGSCHFRDTNHRILSSGGFIRHHEQFDEMISAKHTALNCTSCHDPHIGVRYGNADAGGIRASCESCHPDQTANNKHATGFPGAPTCVDCHMGRASKSARKVHDHEGDIRTHIFKIQTAAVDASDPTDGMWFLDEGVEFSRGHVTLDFACYGCHKDAGGVGGPNSIKDLNALSGKAMGIHDPPVPKMAEK